MPSAKASIRWRTNVGGPLRYLTLDRDGRIYGAAAGTSLIALSPDGQVLWSLPDAAYGTEIPLLVAPDGRIHTWNGSEWLIIDNAGAILKRTRVLEGTGSLPLAVASDGTIYVNGLSLRAYSPDGALKWEIPGTPALSAVLDPQGNIYTATQEGFGPPRQLEAFSPQGTNLWRVPFTENISHPFAVRQEGLVLLRNVGELAAFDFNGQLLWTNASRVLFDAQIIGPEGNIYGRSSTTNFYAFDSSGTLKWTFPSRVTDPMVSAQGNIYLDTAPGIVVLDSNGQKLWALTSTNGANFGFAMAPDGTLYVCLGTDLVAMSTSDTPSEFTWSIAGGNMQRTRQLRQPSASSLEVISLTVNTSGTPTLLMKVPSGQNDTIQSSTDLKTWSDASVTRPTPNTVSIDLPATSPHQFFRLRGSNP